MNQLFLNLDTCPLCFNHLSGGQFITISHLVFNKLTYVFHCLKLFHFYQLLNLKKIVGHISGQLVTGDKLTNGSVAVVDSRIKCGTVHLLLLATFKSGMASYLFTVYFTPIMVVEYCYHSQCSETSLIRNLRSPDSPISLAACSLLTITKFG